MRSNAHTGILAAICSTLAHPDRLGAHQAVTASIGQDRTLAETADVTRPTTDALATLSLADGSARDAYSEDAPEKVRDADNVDRPGKDARCASSTNLRGLRRA